MTELSFLIELLLKHKLPNATKQLVAERIKEVESTMHVNSAPRPLNPAPVGVVPPHLVGQAPSTIAKLMQHEANGAPVIPPQPPAETTAIQPEVVAQTPIAMQALAQRNQMIADAIKGKKEPKQREFRDR